MTIKLIDLLGACHKPDRRSLGEGSFGIRSRRAYYRGDFSKISVAVKSQLNICPMCGEGPLEREFLRAYYVIPPESLRWMDLPWEEHTCYGVEVRRPWDTEENIGVLCIECYDDRKSALRAEEDSPQQETSGHDR